MKILRRRISFLALLTFISSIASVQAAVSGTSQKAPARSFEALPDAPLAYQPITPRARLKWFVRSTIGGTSLIGGLFSSGLGTAIDTPSEYGPHWDGFAKRYGMRLTGISTGNAMEAALGAAWGEDPRYFTAIQSPFGSRVKNIVDLTFRAYGADRQRHLAYARYTATLGNNFLSNTWRAQSEADWQHALVRTAEGFGVRALSNTFREFAPQVWNKLRHKPDPPAEIDLP
ncbi:MAG TPA: hypothetical protein VN753_15780 [Terracidiphilus sp.]|nr:hypothetical protein [Terracidiphilus sp.]